jgi:hypothetical protein
VEVVDITMYHPKKVNSSRTHEDTIDIEVFEPCGKVRIFISLDLAQELIQKMALAIILPKQED